MNIVIGIQIALQMKNYYLGEKMKFILSFVILCNLAILNAFVVPYSGKELKTPQNHITGFVRISPDDSEQLDLPTDIWLWQDSKDLYIKWEATIDSTFDKGNFVPNDHYPDADFLRVQIITNEKNYYAYIFYAFPLNSKLDGIRNENMNMDNNWNSSYEYKNNFSAHKWCSIMKIPFKDLRFSGKSPYNWKIIFSRYKKKADQYYSIPYLQTSMRKDYFRKAFAITIPNKIASNKNYKIKPYLIYKYDLDKKKSSFDKNSLGLDFSFNPGFSTKVKVSINPDFSDVPIDDEKDNFNVKYAPRFRENRYFFVEDLDVFGVSDFLFYSRNIMQPKYAVKITSDNSKNSWGVLSSLDKKITQDGEITNRDDFYNIAAYKYKGDKLNFQMTLLNRMKDKYHNEVLHLTPSWEFIENNYLSLSSNLSLWKDKTEKKGHLSSFSYSGKKGDMNWNLNVSRCSKDFKADMGDVNQTDYYSMNMNFNYNNNDNNSGRFITNFGFSGWGNGLIDDFNDDKPTKSAGFNYWFNTKNDFNLWTNINIGSEDYENKLFDWYSANIGIKYEKYSNFEPSVDFAKSKTLVYALENMYNKKSLSLSIEGILKPFVSYETSLVFYKYSDLPKTEFVDDSYCLGNANLNFNLSNSLGISNGLRYNNYESGVYSKHLGFYSNLHWEYNSDCTIYFGYSTAENDIENVIVKDYENLYLKILYTF